MVEEAIVSFRAPHGCPVCLSPDNGKWTCPDCTVLVETHRNLIRNLQDWRVLFEEGQADDVIVSSDGRSYSLWDVHRFYEYRSLVPTRMRQSIQYCLFENMKEKDAAVAMGIAPSNPVSIYATVGLTTLLTKAVEGDLPNYKIEMLYVKPVEPTEDLKVAV